MAYPREYDRNRYTMALYPVMQDLDWRLNVWASTVPSKSDWNGPRGLQLNDARSTHPPTNNTMAAWIVLSRLE